MTIEPNNVLIRRTANGWITVQNNTTFVHEDIDNAHDSISKAMFETFPVLTMATATATDLDAEGEDSEDAEPAI